MDRAALGKLGEEIALRYLENRGYVITGRRVRFGGVEIDLVAEQGDEVVFIEVKTRACERFGQPEESVTAGKRQRLRQAAYSFVAARRPAPRFRIDVIAVLFGPTDKIRLRHYRNAVGEEE